MSSFTESIVEAATLEWFEQLGYTTLPGNDIAPGEPNQERTTYADVVLSDRLYAALERINPQIPADTLAEAVRKVTLSETANLIENNRRFHKLLIDGVDVEYQTATGTVYNKVWLIDFDHPTQNDWLAVNQFTVIEAAGRQSHQRRPDVVVLINGLPIAVLELKNPAAENATLRGAFNQLQTYKTDIPSLFPCNEILVISDGTEARVGTLTADWERFMPWRTITGDDLAAIGTPELEVVIQGIFEKTRLLDLLRHFIVFEVDGPTIIKKLAGYHQFHAVNKAVAATLEATAPTGNKKAGVVWHTQGSGKSLSMVFYAGKIVRHPDMANPTLVILTDRNDLDDQLFGTFAHCQDLLRQTPVQAEDRSHLQNLLQIASGGVIFTTIQKFSPPERGEDYPQLSDRRNIIFIADEAHRSQYGTKARVVQTTDKTTGEEEAYLTYGFAKYLRDALPHASFIGFTGTPIEATDKSTKSIFGDYIDIYDIQQAVEDGATVRIYYEARLAKIALEESEKPKIDPNFEEITEGEELTTKQKLKSKWAQLEAVVGSDKRIGQVAQDIVTHFETRLGTIEGKGMIVSMSRRICVALYEAIVQLRPDWHHDDDAQGVIKVVMTGSAADDPDWQRHIRNKPRREALAKRLKDPADPLKLVIVRDMWLTGFDAPCLHTMYIDKPMQGHGLMQAIARVNRVFRDKPGGLVVDYLGIAESRKKALVDYTEGDRGKTGIPTADAVAVMQEKYEIVCNQLHGFDYGKFYTGSPTERLTVLRGAMDFILRPASQAEGGVQRFIQTVTELSQAFALCSTEAGAIEIREDVGFFQAIKATLVKSTVEGSKSPVELDTAVRQIVSQAIASDEVVDIFAAAGLNNPDISILSDEFLAEMRGLPQKNLALEVLRRLLNDEIKARSRQNLVQSRTFSEMLERAIHRYQNRAIESAQVIEELIEMAKDFREASRRGQNLGLSDDELAFYDALEVNDSAVKLLGDETLRAIARDLVETVRRTVTIDWTVKESVRAKLRVTVKRLLKKHGYPPDKQEEAIITILQQSELLCKDWA